MPFAVRNLEAGRAVFSDLRNDIAIEWSGAGDIDGNDVQQVPDELAQNVNFLKAVQQGVFKVEEASPDIEAALAKQAGAWRRRQSEAQEKVVEAINPETNNDLVPIPCVGPGQRAGAVCGTEVLIRDKNRGERPPLCQRHANLAHEYVMSETDKIVNGKAERKWTRMAVTEREHQQV